MTKVAFFRSIAAAFLALAGLGAHAQAATAAWPTKEWTVLIYMNGKNDLEEFAIQDFAELATVGSSQGVDFVVQMGRPLRRPAAQLRMKQVHGGWSGVRRFHVKRDGTPDPGKEMQVVGGAEVDMGSPKTLEAFLKWGKARFPAKRYAAVVWNHGQGYRMVMSPDAAAASIAKDPQRVEKTQTGYTYRAVSQDVDSGSIIYNADIRSAVMGAFPKDLKLLGFDACLMAMVEAAYEFRDVAPVMVASEELEPGAGWDYAKVATALIAKPTMNEEEFAVSIVEAYRQAYGNNDDTTLSAVRLGQAKALASELSKLSNALLADRGTLFPLVTKARSEREAYNEPRNPVTVDLVGFLESLEGWIVKDAAGSPALAFVRSARSQANSMVLANYKSSSRSGAFGSNGLAIYFPATRAAFDRDDWSEGYIRSNAFKRIDFVTNEQWSLFLQAYLALPP